jgi:hypothetical protein
MPHYSFYLLNGGLCSDAGGLDLPDDEAARMEADLTACDLRDIPGEDWSEWTVEVRDARGRRVIALPIGR